ncbi:MAG TPA: galactokinase [Streptosporangiaceae bacterium]|nr:galactokinase [Streptosporangiaceae bacterium]
MKFFAPGRANLMGEHTDYNDGYVLPFAIAQGTTATATMRDDGMLAVSSRQQAGQEASFCIKDLAPGTVSGWAAYPAAVAWALGQHGLDVPGATIEIDSDLPPASGLSSSHAMECAVALALTGLTGQDVPRMELAKIVRTAENDFVGAPTGIMDQAASLLGEAGHLLLIDCATLRTEQVPFAGRMLVINTNASHANADGGYGTRRAECEEAARLLSVTSLGSITDCGITVALSATPALERRARHICTDDNRVRRVVSLLREPHGNVHREIGELLIQSHASLRDDFEVSWPQADVTVDAAVAAGALGARMIGGGFGGSVLALLDPSGSFAEAAEPVMAAVTAAYVEQAWPPPAFLEAVPSQGARRVA